MNCNCYVYIAASMDGYIARPDGSVDWLSEYTSSGSTEDYGYGAFMELIDTIVMGRKIYELAATFGSWPYVGKKVVVLTRGKLRIPASLSGSVETASGTPDRIVENLERKGSRNVYVDGGETIQEFLRAGMIQRMTVTRVPRLLGKGRPLFGVLEADVELRHVKTDAYGNGLVQSTYDVEGKRAS